MFRRMLRAILLSCVILTCAMPVQASGFVSGALLLQMCTENGGLKNPTCEAYLAGAQDLLILFQQSSAVRTGVCLPSDATGLTNGAIILEYLGAHQSDLASNSGAALAWVALFQKYPCG